MLPPDLFICWVCAALQSALDSGDDVDEVEGAGNTPLHAAAYEGFLQGCELLLSRVSVGLWCMRACVSTVWGCFAASSAT